MADNKAGYSSVPQSEYSQPPGYSDPAYSVQQLPGYSEHNQPLHQPVNNSFGTQPQPPPGPPGGGYPRYQDPQPAYNPGQYGPAPPQFHQQQQSNTNVVVVGQQPQAAPVIHMAPPKPPTYLVLSVVLMVVCFIHGNLPAFVCLVPALICSLVAQDHNSGGRTEDARTMGKMALCCNIFSIVYYVLIVIGAIILVIIYFTGLVVLSRNENINNNPEVYY